MKHFDLRCPKCRSEHIIAPRVLVHAIAPVNVNELYAIDPPEEVEVDPSDVNYEEVYCEDCEYEFEIEVTTGKDHMYQINIRKED